MNAQRFDKQVYECIVTWSRKLRKMQRSRAAVCLLGSRERERARKANSRKLLRKQQRGYALPRPCSSWALIKKTLRFRGNWTTLSHIPTATLSYIKISVCAKLAVSLEKKNTYIYLGSELWRTIAIIQPNAVMLFLSRDFPLTYLLLLTLQKHAGIVYPLLPTLHSTNATNQSTSRGSSDAIFLFIPLLFFSRFIESSFGGFPHTAHSVPRSFVFIAL